MRAVLQRVSRASVTVDGEVVGELTRPGHADGPRWLASFRRPHGVAVDAAGRVYVADTGNNSIRIVR